MWDRFAPKRNSGGYKRGFARPLSGRSLNKQGAGEHESCTDYAMYEGRKVQQPYTQRCARFLITQISTNGSSSADVGRTGLVMAKGIYQTVAILQNLLTSSAHQSRPLCGAVFLKKADVGLRCIMSSLTRAGVSLQPVDASC